MGTIHRPFDSGSAGTESNAFIQCVDDREPQIHEFWCLCLDEIIREVHPTSRVEVTFGSVGEFVKNYLSENGRRINIIRKISSNNSVQTLGVPDQVRGSGLLFIINLLARVESTGWGSGNYFNKYWGGRFNDAYSMKNFALTDSVDPLYFLLVADSC